MVMGGNGLGEGGLGRGGPGGGGRGGGGKGGGGRGEGGRGGGEDVQPNLLHFVFEVTAGAVVSRVDGEEVGEGEGTWKRFWRLDTELMSLRFSFMSEDSSSSVSDSVLRRWSGLKVPVYLVTKSASSMPENSLAEVQ
jgi:hypothetical protein